MRPSFSQVLFGTEGCYEKRYIFDFNLQNQSFGSQVSGCNANSELVSRYHWRRVLQPHRCELSLIFQSINHMVWLLCTNHCNLAGGMGTGRCFSSASVSSRKTATARAKHAEFISRVRHHMQTCFQEQTNRCTACAATTGEKECYTSAILHAGFASFECEISRL